ncbi:MULTISPECIES: hypothetical protein [Staphylococcus]|uniref:hypothetical protein n=1 Tax=Staphylococcus TaxID=1279 RepID=UPI001AEBF3E7|nr:hypothetical protein [Staphylococcus sp. GDY8P196P]
MIILQINNQGDYIWITKKEINKIGWNSKEVENRIESLIDDGFISSKENDNENIENLIEKESDNSTLNEFLNK